MVRLASDGPSQEPKGWAAQAEAYDVACQVQNDRAARVVAGQAHNARDCRELLDMLGIETADRPLL